MVATLTVLAAGAVPTIPQAEPCSATLEPLLSLSQTPGLAYLEATLAELSSMKDKMLIAGTKRQSSVATLA